MKSIESNFTVDSSGFSTSRFVRYFSFKHGRDIKYKSWLKAHIAVGVKTNIITDAIITEERENDSPRLKPLIEDTSENFTIEEVTADKAYSSSANLDYVDSIGCEAYIPFKKNTTGKQRGSQTWSKMYYYFMYQNDEFMEHYRKRSNVETTFHMVMRAESQQAMLPNAINNVIPTHLHILFA